MTKAVLATVANWTAWLNSDAHNKYIYNFTVIPSATTILVEGTRCDGRSECWNNEDEIYCGFGNFNTFSIGK